MILSLRVGRIFISRQERIKRAPWTIPQKHTDAGIQRGRAQSNWRTLLHGSLQWGLPDGCRIPSPPSSPYLPLQKYHGQGEILCDNTHTHTTTGQRIHQGDMGRLSVTLWSLAGNLAAGETRLGRRKSQSAMQKLLVNYIKAVTRTTRAHTHTTHTPAQTYIAPMLHAELWNDGGKISAPPLELWNIIHGPSFLSNTPRCLYSKPCLDKFASIRSAEKIKRNQSTYNSISGVAAAHFRWHSLRFPIRVWRRTLQKRSIPLPLHWLRESPWD